jgi:hypothetical protein
MWSRNLGAVLVIIVLVSYNIENIYEATTSRLDIINILLKVVNNFLNSWTIDINGIYLFYNLHAQGIAMPLLRYKPQTLKYDLLNIRSLYYNNL